MRNPERWQLPENDPRPIPDRRNAALIGLGVVLILVLGGLLLAHVLGGMTREQDCALSGRSNCFANPQ
jgi:hypothetical protein